VGKITVVDTTRIRVWYAFNADNVKDVNTYIDQQRLDIGKRVTKYYSDFLFRSDSLLAVWSKAHPGARTVPNSFTMSNGGKKEGTWSEYEYSDLFISNGKLTEYATMPMWLGKYNAYYTEPYPLQQWKMGAETQTVLGHRCQKATCHWRGRDFVAWFASDIPVKAGPWKFGGLPGLIVKVYDSDRLYDFECVRVEKTHTPMLSNPYKKHRPISRSKVLKFERKVNEDSHRTLGWVRVEGPQPLPVHYEPIELE
jgi:GLPGLI family protein